MAAAKRSWSEAKNRTFIDTLASTCNVTKAAAAAHISISAVYRRRAQDASFRAAWGQALSIGYAQLEIMMLERALHGVERIIDLKNGETRVMRDYCDRTALTLLKMHRDSAVAAEEPVDAHEYEEACERIIARLKRLREREGGEVETKAVTDRLAWIKWALRRSSEQAFQRSSGQAFQRSSGQARKRAPSAS